jgi:hypothetical protein
MFGFGTALANLKAEKKRMGYTAKRHNPIVFF